MWPKTIPLRSVLPRQDKRLDTRGAEYSSVFFSWIEKDLNAHMMIFVENSIKSYEI